MAGKKDFGFGIQAGRQIDLDLADNALADEIAGAVSAWRACINCGSCSATCPAGQNGGLNFRQIHYKIRMAVDTGTNGRETDSYPSVLSSCMLCGKCQLVCPRGIPTRYLSIQIMQKMRQYAEAVPSV